MGTWKANSPGDLDQVAVDLLKTYPGSRVFACYGEMGAGKTTLIKALCKSLDVKENVSSPTFALVNEYQNIKGSPVYHFDFYRIENIREAMELGLREYFNSGNYCFVEWPENILHLLPEEAVRIKINVNNETRIITTENG